MHVNQPWLTATGYTQEHVLGGSRRMLQGSETCQRTMQATRAAARHPDAATPAPLRAPRPRRSTLSCAAAFSAIAGPARCYRPITVRLLNYKVDGTSFVNDLTVLPVTDAASSATTHFLGAATAPCQVRVCARAGVLPPLRRKD